MPEDAAERYWQDYLSDNTRRLLAFRCTSPGGQGPNFKLEDIAANLSITYAETILALAVNGEGGIRTRDGV
jgi:hypothetical protein